jgi:hypothetical protein
MFLLISFLHVLPYSAVLWSTKGMLPQPSLNYTYGWFPDILYHFDTPSDIYRFLIILSVFSMLFILGIYRRPVAFILWYGWACLFNRNILVSNPGYPFIGWMLLMFVVVPAGEPLSLSRKSDPNWKLPPIVLIGGWIILALGYSYSGIEKLIDSPSWRNGSTIKFLMDSVIARDWFITDAFKRMPDTFLRLVTWFILFLECLYAPLCLFNISRKYAWIAMVFVHLCILLFIDITDVALSMILIHLFFFDFNWLKSKDKTLNLLDRK